MVFFIVACAATMVGQSAQATETTTYVLTDAQGTVLAREDAHGTTIATYDYRPYGKQQTGPTTAGPGYTGHVDDPDTGLVYMQARYYDPMVGRFLTVDKIAPVAGSTFSFNRYSYGLNNPIAHIDPDGNCPDACVIEGGVVVTAGAVYVVAGGLILAGVCKVECGKLRDAIAGAGREVWQKITQDSRSAPPPPLPEADGAPHSIPDGKGGYTSYPTGKATEGKQYRPTGKPHGNIPRPNVKEWKPNIAPDGTEYPGKGQVRPPEPNEIPRQPEPPSPPEPSNQEAS